MKKIIVICYGLGGASGIVFQQLICGLSNYYDITLVVSDKKETLKLPSNVVIQVVSYFRLPAFLSKYLIKTKILIDNGFLQLNAIIPRNVIKLLGSNPWDKVWGNRIKKCIKNKECSNYSFVLGLMGYNCFQPLIATTIIGECFSLKTALYTTDANPVTSFWDPDDKYRARAKKLLNCYYQKLDLLFFSNEIMAEYEKNLFGFGEKPTIGVVLTNTTEKRVELEKPRSATFLYTGSIWGPRTTKYLFAAFKLLLKDYADSKLCFVGTRENGFSEEELSIFSELEKKSVISYSRTSNLVPFYNESICFIDLNADAEGDPFLSSKITNYILFDRPIICETGINSAAEKLFKGYDSIYVCKHDVQELYEAMVSVIKRHGNYNYSERKTLIDTFSTSTVASKMHKELISIEK